MIMRIPNFTPSSATPILSVRLSTTTTDTVNGHLNVTATPPKCIEGDLLKTLPQEAIEDLVDLYFKSPVLLLQPLHKPSYSPPHLPHQPPLVVYALLALAAPFSTHPAVLALRPCLPNGARDTNKWSTGDAFFKEARKLLMDHIDSPSVSTIQALVLLRLFAQARGTPQSSSNSNGGHAAVGGTRGFMYAAIATHQAQLLHLSTDPSTLPTPLTELEKEERRRLGWILWFMSRISGGGWDDFSPPSTSFAPPPSLFPGGDIVQVLTNSSSSNNNNNNNHTKKTEEPSAAAAEVFERCPVRPTLTDAQFFALPPSYTHLPAPDLNPEPPNPLKRTASEVCVLLADLLNLLNRRSTMNPKEFLKELDSVEAVLSSPDLAEGLALMEKLVAGGGPGVENPAVVPAMSPERKPKEKKKEEEVGGWRSPFEKQTGWKESLGGQEKESMEKPMITLLTLAELKLLKSCFTHAENVYASLCTMFQNIDTKEWKAEMLPVLVGHAVFQTALTYKTLLIAVHPSPPEGLSVGGLSCVEMHKRCVESFKGLKGLVEVQGGVWGMYERMWGVLEGLH
ncbi:hypothetical protein HDV05_002524 [Chytridiales sp. JEL 0842]|nr:hypothetical protein HDV05_002524 [Chytridiales sp. JEL 0842]